jgi:hypothetical protein
MTTLRHFSMQDCVSMRLPVSKMHYTITGDFLRGC